MSVVLAAPRRLPGRLPDTVCSQIYELGRALDADGRSDDAVRVFAEAAVTAARVGNGVCAAGATTALSRLLLDEALFHEGRLTSVATTAAGRALEAVTGPRLGAVFPGDWALALLTRALLLRDRLPRALLSLQAAVRIRREAGIVRDDAEGLVAAVLRRVAGLTVPVEDLALDLLPAPLSAYRSWSLRVAAEQAREAGDLTHALNWSSAAVSVSWSITDEDRRVRVEAAAVRERSRALAALGRDDEAVESAAMAVLLDAMTCSDAFGGVTADPSPHD